MTTSDQSLEWEVRLSESNRARQPVLVIVAVLAGLIGWQMLSSPLAGVIASAVIFMSTAEVFLPLKYRIDEKGARVRCGISTTAILWEDVKRLLDMPDGIRLSPLETPSRLDAFRGVHLRFGSRRDEVLGKIDEFWRTDGREVAREAGPE
jgi:hypothetical protein